jgi:hypothetical protein
VEEEFESVVTALRCRTTLVEGEEPMGNFSLLSPAVWAAYVAGLLNGVFALVGIIYAARNERSRRTESARREDLIWFRNAIAEAYSEALFYLFKLSVSSQTAPRTDKDVRQHLSEAQRNLLLLYAYQPDQSKRDALMEQVNALDNEKSNLSAAATSAGTVVRTQFQSDTRINVEK